METGVIKQSAMQKFGRMDVSFLLLAVKHGDVIDELLAKFTHKELADLAVQLPYDEAVATRVIGTGVNNMPKRKFDLWARGLGYKLRKTTDLAVYCACAAYNAAGKLRLEVVQLKEAATHAENRRLAILRGAFDKRADKLLSALKGEPCSSTGT